MRESGWVVFSEEQGYREVFPVTYDSPVRHRDQGIGFEISDGRLKVTWDFETVDGMFKERHVTIRLGNERTLPRDASNDRHFSVAFCATERAAQEHPLSYRNSFPPDMADVHEEEGASYVELA